MQIETVPDVELIEHLDFDAELACEMPSHESGEFGHVPSEPAAFATVKPCCPNRPLICASGKRGLGATITCKRCGTRFSSDELIFIPLDMP